jgi:prepilin-type N-terminal cleavage/methylation domain-containing protein
MTSRTQKTRSPAEDCRLAEPPRHAFTLIEAMAVIVVLTILAVVATAKYIDFRSGAAAAAERATVGAVREAVSQYRLNAAIAGAPALPESLDAAASGALSAPATPFFGGVLSTPITDGWQKGSSANTYIGPAGNTYVYDPATGQFAGTGTAVAGGGGSTPPAGPTTTLITAATWTNNGSTSNMLAPGTIIASGYSLSGTALDLTESSARLGTPHVAISGQGIAAGDYTLDLETQLTDYDSQWNYWAVYAVARGVQFSLTNGSYYGSAPAGTKLLTQNYAPPGQSNGAWYAYSNAFTVSAADVAAYDTLVVVMTGSKADGQSLGWRNVAFTKR